MWVSGCVRMAGGRGVGGEGAELMAATGPGRHGVFVKMTSSCSIVTGVLLHLLSSSPSLHSFVLLSVRVCAFFKE